MYFKLLRGLRSYHDVKRVDLRRVVGKVRGTRVRCFAEAAAAAAVGALAVQLRVVPGTSAAMAVRLVFFSYFAFAFQSLFRDSKF